MPDRAWHQAPRQSHRQRADDPFATPISTPTSFPSPPKPCARLATQPSVREVRPGATLAYRLQPPSVESWISPPLGSQPRTPASIAAPESRTPRDERAHEWSDEEGSWSSMSGDLEKRSHDMSLSHDSRHSRTSRTSGLVTSITYDDTDDFDPRRAVVEKNAAKVLLFMSGPCLAVSILNAVWVWIAILIATLSLPFRLCSSGSSFGKHLSSLLAPALNLQLRGIYAPPLTENDRPVYNTGTLAFIHMISPFVSFVVMFASWTLAVYWVSSLVVGDPAGQDKRDDGKETVLALRDWWERWLMKGVRTEA